MVLFVTLLVSHAYATSFYIRPFSEFTKTTPVIARGVLHNIHAENAMTPEGRTIYTFATLEVKEVLKGPIHEGNLLVRKTGGTKDGTTLDIPGSPEFVEGDDTVLYLSEQREDQAYEVSGLELGKFGLKEENHQEILTGGLFNYSTSENTQTNDPNDHNEQASDISENQRPWSLTQVKELIRKQGDAPINPAPPHSPQNVTTHQETGTATTTQTDTSTPQSDEASHKNPSQNSALENQNFLLYWVLGGAALGLIFFYLRRR